MFLSTRLRLKSFLALGCLNAWALLLASSLTQAGAQAPAPRPAGEEEARVPRLPKGLIPLTPEQSRLLAQLGIDRWNAAGFRGKGIKVAILDSGFRGYKTFLGGVLPEHVTVRSFRPDRNFEVRDSQHGILCGEVIHTVAPEAELLMANWDEDNPASFLEAVLWARQQGARVITCSVITPDWSDGDGGGSVHEALTKVLGPGTKTGDLLFFASAGNTAERAWYGQFQPGPDGFHLWQKGQENNILTPWGTDQVMVELYCRPESSYDLYAYDVTLNREVGHATTTRDLHDRHYAVVDFMPEDDHVYEVRVRLAQGKAGMFHLVALSSDSLSTATARGSISFPADGHEVIAMGAVDDKGHRWSYSSCGGISPQEKPDFVALVPFPTHWRKQPFSGTSAASPEGAALAALWWSRHLEWTADQVHEAMRHNAHDVGPRGDDWETGYGLLTMPNP